MILSEADARLFYELWFPLLDYVNEKFHVNDSLGKIHGAKSSDPNDIKKVADKLWENAAVIDEYLSVCDDLTEEHRAIISGWKRCISCNFFLERHLKKGSIFISIPDEEVYQVSGIISSWEEIFWYRDPPILMTATLIPFKNVIISDGLVIPANVEFGSNYKSDLKDIYLSAKKVGKIHRTL